MADFPVSLLTHPDGRAELVFAEAALSGSACALAQAHAEALAQTGAGEQAARVVTLRGGTAGASAGVSAPWPQPPPEIDGPAVTAVRSLVEAVAALPMPVVALLEGEVAAEGLELAMK